MIGLKKYYFYLIEEDFYSLFSGDNMSSFLEMFFRKESSTYYQKQFDLFVKDIDVAGIRRGVIDKFLDRNDFAILDNGFSLNNYITSNKETMTFCHNCIVVETDHEVSPFIGLLSDIVPDFVGIDVNNYKIDRIGLVSSLKFR